MALNYKISKHVSESDILGPTDYLRKLRIWYHLKGLCLKIPVQIQNENISIFYVNITTLK